MVICGGIFIFTVISAILLVILGWWIRHFSAVAGRIRHFSAVARRIRHLPAVTWGFSTTRT